MTPDTQTPDRATSMELVIFYAGDILCGLPALNVREILKGQKVTPVYHAPPYVIGVINLRGDIVTIIDLCAKMEQDVAGNEGPNNFIIVHYKGENLGLSVGLIDDIIPASTKDIEPPPAHVGQKSGAYLSGIYKMEGQLAAILDIEKLLCLDSD